MSQIVDDLIYKIASRFFLCLVMYLHKTLSNIVNLALKSMDIEEFLYPTRFGLPCLLTVLTGDRFWVPTATSDVIIVCEFFKTQFPSRVHNLESNIFR